MIDVDKEKIKSNKAGYLEALEDVQKQMKKLWDKYEADIYNVPKPDFLTAYALVEIMKGEIC